MVAMLRFASDAQLEALLAEREPEDPPFEDTSWEDLVEISNLLELRTINNRMDAQQAEIDTMRADISSMRATLEACLVELQAINANTTP